MGMIAKGIGATVVVAGIIAAPGTPQAESDAKAFAGFVIGTAWNGAQAAAGGAGAVFGKEGPQQTTPPDTGGKTDQVDADATGHSH